MSTTPLYTQEVINIGANPNDGAGDPLRVAFEKINNNFANLYQTFVNSTVAYTFGNVAGQVIFESPVSTFSQGQFFIKTVDGGTADSQNIQLSAQINNTGDEVKFTGFGTTHAGNALSSYDMTISNGNVQILANPIVNDDMTHLVNSQIMWAPEIPGMYLGADGYVDTAVSSETDVLLTTEQSA